MPSKKKSPARYDRTILDLHNGVNTTRSPIVEALWFSDGAFLEGALLLKDKEARGEIPTLVEYYCLFLAAIQRNDRKTISASLAAARKHYAAEKLWITSMEGQVGAWSQTDTEAIAMLMESGEPLFQGLACRFQGSRCIKNSQRLQREEAPPEAVKAEQLKAAEYFEAGYAYVREVSVFEACRNKHELAQAYPIERMAEKIACSKEAIELAVKCGAMRYQFTANDRYSDLLKLQAASEFLEDQKARFLGDVFRTIKEARTIEEFAERTLDLLCRRSLLRIPQAAFVRRQGYTETVIKRHPAEQDFPVQDLTSIEIGSGYSIRVSTMTDPDGLLFFTRGLRHLFAAAEKRFNYQNPDQTAHSELPFRFGGLELHDLGYKPLYEEFEALKMSSVTEVIGLLGETGTGKSEFAEAFHRELFGQNKKFRAFNCMTLGTVENPAQDPLTEADFFGALAGTFTGQKGPKASVFDMVGDGTLLLDEMGALPLKLQGEFLTLFEKREYHKRGADKDFPFDCRIMVATNRPIDRYAQEWDETGGIFRADLWERINHPVWLPPLRDVPLQIPYVAQVFAEKTLRGRKIEAKVNFDEDARLFLMDTKWPGNLRSVGNVMKKAVLLHLSRYQVAPKTQEIEFSQPLLEEALAKAKSVVKSGRTVVSAPVEAPPATMDTVVVELQKMAHIAPTLGPETIRAWLREMAAQPEPGTPVVTKIPAPNETPGPVATHVPEPEPVAPHSLPLPPTSEPLHLPSAQGTAALVGTPVQSDAREAYLNLFQMILDHLRATIKPLHRVIPKELQPYILTIEKTRSLPRPGSFAKIKACFQTPLLADDPRMRPVIRQWEGAYERCQAKEVGTLGGPLEKPAVGFKPAPEPPIRSRTERPGKGILTDFIAVLWELLNLLPGEKIRYFKKSTISAFYAVRTKPYLFSENIWWDAYRGLKNSPLAATEGNRIEQLLELYSQLKGTRG